MQKEEKESFKFDWQRAFMRYEVIMEEHLGRELKPKEKIMPTTKHVLHALCAYMNTVILLFIIAQETKISQKS